MSLVTETHNRLFFFCFFAPYANFNRRSSDCHEGNQNKKELRRGYAIRLNETRVLTRLSAETLRMASARRDRVRPTDGGAAELKSERVRVNNTQLLLPPLVPGEGFYSCCIERKDRTCYRRERQFETLNDACASKMIRSFVPLSSQLPDWPHNALHQHFTHKKLE